MAREFEIEIRFRHFPLHPETPKEGLTLEQLFAGRNIDIAASQESIRKQIRQEGLPYGKRTMTFNSRLAQELAAWADQQPEGEKIHDLLFKAYFVYGKNIAQLAVLLEVAELAGLSRLDASEVLHSRIMRSTVDGDWKQSRELGITGVPTFIIEQQKLVGAQPFGVLREFVKNFARYRE